MRVTSWIAEGLKVLIMSTLMMPAATITTMTNTAPIAVTHQPKTDPTKMGFITAAAAAANSKQGKLHHLLWLSNSFFLLQMWIGFCEPDEFNHINVNLNLNSLQGPNSSQNLLRILNFRNLLTVSSFEVSGPRYGRSSDPYFSKKSLKNGSKRGHSIAHISG